MSNTIGEIKGFQLYPDYATVTIVIPKEVVEEEKLNTKKNIVETSLMDFFEIVLHGQLAFKVRKRNEALGVELIGLVINAQQQGKRWEEASREELIELLQRCIERSRDL